MSYPLSLLSEFDYRKAQTARGCGPRNLKAKTDLLNWIRQLSYRFMDSDWMFALHSLDSKKLREFAVFLDWSAGRGPSRVHRDSGQHKFDTDHLYAFLNAERREWTELERLWIEALDASGALGGFDLGHGRTGNYLTRPGAYLSKIGSVPRGDGKSWAWPSMLIASFWDPNTLFDTSYLTAIQQSPALAAIRKRYATHSELWLALVDGEIQIQLPIDDHNDKRLS